MKVAHVINQFTFSGGAENQLYMNLLNFKDERIEHHVVALFGAGDPHLEEPGIDVTHLYPEQSTASRSAIYRDLGDVIADIRPGLIHCSLADSALASRLVGRRRRIPVLESLVNISHENIRVLDNHAVRTWKLAAHRIVDQITMRGVTQFHALTNTVAESWIRVAGIPSDRITVIPRGVLVEPLQEAIRTEARASLISELGLSHDALILLHVARQEPQKGQRYLIEAMPQVLSAFPEAHLIMAGREGNSTRMLTKTIEETGVVGNVRFLGVRDDVTRLMRASDVFIFPSLFEGQGVALLEAMSAGLPCVVSDISTFREFVEHGITGWFVPPADPIGLAKGILCLLESESDRRRIGNAAHQIVAQRFEISEVARRMEALYARLGGLD